MKHAERWAVLVAVAILIVFFTSSAMSLSRTCYLGEPIAVLLALGADYVIGISYIMIWGCFLSISRIVFSDNGRLRQRGVETKLKDFTLALWATSAFILLCGCTHLSTIVIYSYPGLVSIVVDLAIRGATALVSVGAYLILARTRRLLLP